MDGQAKTSKAALCLLKGSSNGSQIVHERFVEDSEAPHDHGDEGKVGWTVDVVCEPFLDSLSKAMEEDDERDCQDDFDTCGQDMNSRILPRLARLLSVLLFLRARKVNQS